jgi:hypothetical protein
VSHLSALDLVLNVGEECAAVLTRTEAPGALGIVGDLPED